MALLKLGKQCSFASEGLANGVWCFEGLCEASAEMSSAQTRGKMQILRVHGEPYVEIVRVEGSDVRLMAPEVVSC